MAKKIPACGLSPNATDVYVGARIRARRTELGISLEALARVVGISRRKLSAYDTGIARVTPAGLSAIAAALRVSISYFFDGIGAAEERQPRRWPLVCSPSVALARSSEIAQGRLRPVLEAWWQRQGRWEPNFDEWLRNTGLEQSAVVLRRSHGSRLLVEHWGTDLDFYGHGWPHVAPGRDIEDQPNFDIGLWGAAISMQSINKRSPVLASTEVVVQSADSPPTRHQFLRLALPWWNSDGTTMVTVFKGSD